MQTEGRADTHTVAGKPNLLGSHSTIVVIGWFSHVSSAHAVVFDSKSVTINSYMLISMHTTGGALGQLSPSQSKLSY